MTLETTGVRLTGVLRALDIATSSWYRKPIPEDQRRRPGPKPKPIPPEVIEAVVKMATEIDYYSRYLLACHLTNSYSAGEAICALELAREEAERICGPLQKTPFLVTDNGPSFIARKFGRFIEDLYRHVRIQYRTPTQLGLLERFHRTLKEEEIYWRLYDSPAHCRECLEEFRQRYNRRRPHWALIPAAGGDPLVPEEVYRDGCSITIPRWQGWAKGAKEKLDKMLTGAA